MSRTSTGCEKKQVTRRSKMKSKPKAAPSKKAGKALLIIPMKATIAEIQQWLAANPNATSAQMTQAASQAGVTAAQFSAALGSPGMATEYTPAQYETLMQFPEQIAARKLADTQYSTNLQQGLISESGFQTPAGVRNSQIQQYLAQFGGNYTPD